MKKILLILAIVVCVGVTGTALALTNYHSADSITGTVAADSALILSLGQCVDTDIELEPGVPEKYTIVCDVTRSAHAGNQTGTLTITLANAGGGQDLDDVTVTLYNNIACSEEYAIEGKVQHGAGTITITGISVSTTYYALITTPNLSDDDAEDVGGTMTLHFVLA